MMNRALRQGTTRSILIGILALLTLACGRAIAGDEKGTIHGPVLTWHQRPTDSVTVTWVERHDQHAVVGASEQWRVGKAGFGYGDNDDNTELRDMRNKYSRVYLRRTFTLEETPGDEPAVLHVRYDDGFIAYLNGHEIARRGVDKGRGPEAKKISSHEAQGDYETIALDRWAKTARKGRNVLAIEAHNSGAGSSDLTIDPYLTVDRKAKTVDLIPRHDHWIYLAGRDPIDNWTGLEFEIPDAVAALARAAAEAAEIEPKFMEPIAWVRRADSQKWRRVKGSSRPFADSGNKVHIAPIDKLTADTEYAIAVGEKEPTGDTRILRFRTAPRTLARPLRFVTGGDMEIGAIAKAMNRQAGAVDPLFALLGGDLAYANGRDAAKWYAWLDNWVKFAVTPDGRAVPMIIVIGNHETGSKLTEQQAQVLGTHPRAKFFYSLFSFPENKSSFVVDFEDYLSVFALDSDHTQSVESQTDWLDGALTERRKQRYRFVCYHRPAYGTAKTPSLSVQKHWAPLFDEHQVTAVFENDHHTYKRTFPLRGGEVDHERGIVYFGDGAWGVGVRPVPDLSLRQSDPEIRIDPKTGREMWHLARAESRNHFWLVTLTPTGARYEAIDKDGEVFDHWPQSKKRGGS